MSDSIISPVSSIPNVLILVKFFDGEYKTQSTNIYPVVKVLFLELFTFITFNSIFVVIGFTVDKYKVYQGAFNNPLTIDTESCLLISIFSLFSITFWAIKSEELARKAAVADFVL